MKALSDVAMIESIARIEEQLAQLRVDAYVRAGIPLPGQCERMARLLEAAASTFNMSTGVLAGANRAKRFCRARFAVMWVAREVWGFSTPVIGRSLGDRDHTTVLSGLKRCEAWREDEPEYRDVTDRLAALFQPKQPDQEATDATRH
jgi:chromosomal replication initiation ATPase DnaA